MKYFYIYLLSCFVVFFSSTTFADGLYLRATGGITSTSFDNNNRATPTSSTFPVNINASATGFNGGLALGYGKKLNNFYLAGEFRGLYDNSEASVNNLNPANVTFEQKLLYTYSASLLPGYYFHPRFLLFTRLGISGGLYQSKIPGPASNGNLGVVGKYTRQIWGGIFGFGIQAFLTQQIALALEYNYVYYPKFTESRTIGIQKVDYDYKIRSNKGLFSLIYYFSKPPKEQPLKVIPIKEALATDNPKPGPYTPQEAKGALAPRLSTYYEERTQKTAVVGLSEPNLQSKSFQPNHAPLPNPELLGG